VSHVLADCPRAAVSVVVPVLNEALNLPVLVPRIQRALAASNTPFELIIVLDGCTDESLNVLLAMVPHCPFLQVIDLARSVGQHAALAVGLQAAQGEYLVTLDADLQNPPEALPSIVARLAAGADAVGTIRGTRQDRVHRSVASAIFTSTLRVVGVRHRMRDPGCMLRGWRRAVVEAFLNSGEPPLYLPVQLNRRAATYQEFVAQHHPRSGGDSRYDALRLARLFYRSLMAQVAPQLQTVAPAQIRGRYPEGRP
jgi:undecaprenyl-phosphate 4-deoxy-4-formamido-L-arabinose transferase